MDDREGCAQPINTSLHLGNRASSSISIWSIRRDLSREFFEQQIIREKEWEFHQPRSISSTMAASTV